MFYVYEWFNVKTKDIFYVGKGIGNRYKQTRKRNKLFLDYIKNNECDVRIIEYFENEKDAFDYEYNRIFELKKKKQCICNLDNGGKGGVNFCWTPEMREYYSKYNIMKTEKQRKRMSENNPMKKPEIAKKMAQTKSKKIVIGNKIYSSIIEAAKELNVYDTAIQYWLERGYSNDYKICYYYGEKTITVSIKTHSCNCKPVVIDDKKFRTVKDGAKFLNTTSSILIEYIKKNKPYKGHICRYDNQQPSHKKSSNKSIVEGSTTNE